MYTQVRIRMVGRFDDEPSTTSKGPSSSVPHPSDDSDWFCTICNAINLGGQSVCSNRLCARDRKVCGVAQASTRKRQAPMRFDQEGIGVDVDPAGKKMPPPVSKPPPVCKRRAKAARIMPEDDADCSDATISPPISPATFPCPPLTGRPLSPESSGLVENIRSKAEAAAAAVVARWQQEQHTEKLLQQQHRGDACCEPLCAVPSDPGDLVTCVNMPPKLAAKFVRKAHLESDLVESGWAV